MRAVAGPSPYTLEKRMPAEYVGMLAVCGCSLLFSATTYSRCSLRSVRENATMPGPSEA